MKRKFIIFLLIVLISIFAFNIKSYAMTLPWLTISSNNYPEGKITSSVEEINKVEVGKTLQLYAHILQGHDIYIPEDPDNMGLYVIESNLNNITWSSSDTSIATIDSQGKITGLKEGIITITAINNDSTNFEEERKATQEIEITKSSDTTNYSLKISSNNNPSLPESMKVNDKLQLKAILDSDNESIESKDVTAKGATWTSSNQNIVKIDNNGLITAIAKGTATITATYKLEDKELSATYNVKVNDSSITPVTPDKKDDPTIAPSKNLPNTGLGLTIALIGSIVLIIICGIAVFSKYKKLKDIR